MDKARLLSALSAAMMRQFSARTADRLKQDALFGVLLPVFQEFLDINVSKEIEKDRRVIDCAVAALRSSVRFHSTRADRW